MQTLTNTHTRAGAALENTMSASHRAWGGGLKRCVNKRQDAHTQAHQHTYTHSHDSTPLTHTHTRSHTHTTQHNTTPHPTTAQPRVTEEAPKTHPRARWPWWRGGGAGPGPWARPKGWRWTASGWQGGQTGSPHHPAHAAGRPPVARSGGHSRPCHHLEPHNQHKKVPIKNTKEGAI